MVWALLEPRTNSVFTWTENSIFVCTLYYLKIFLKNAWLTSVHVPLLHLDGVEAPHGAVQVEVGVGEVVHRPAGEVQRVGQLHGHLGHGHHLPGGDGVAVLAREPLLLNVVQHGLTEKDYIINYQCR